MKNVRDKYSKAIRYLRAHPEEIGNAWYRTKTHKAGCLFAFLNKDNTPLNGSGCLSMVSSTGSPHIVLGHENLTKRIKADTSIGDVGSSINIPVSKLKRFAYWQRIVDKEVRNSAS